MDYKALLNEQIQLLADWNKKHLNDRQQDSAEQVRRNIKTIVFAISLQTKNHDYCTFGQGCKTGEMT